MAIYPETPTPELEIKKQELGYYPKPNDFEPVPTYPEDHHWHGFPRCQAWNPKKGRQCMGLAMVSLGINKETGKPFDKCKGCGGKTPRGRLAPGFKHGRYSNYLPERLVDKYDKLITDTDIMDMRSRVELLETRIVEIVENLDGKGSFRIFNELKKKWDLYEKYIDLSRTADPDRAKEYTARAVQALRGISELIDDGLKDSALWDEIRDITESIRKLADTEQRQIKTSESAVMIDRVMVFSMSMASIFKDIVMNISNLPLSNRKEIVASMEAQVSKLLQKGDYPEVIDGEFTDKTTN
jgi:hypothetical protein